MRHLFEAKSPTQKAARRKAAYAAAVLAMTLAVAVGGVSTASLLAAQPAALTVETVLPQSTAEQTPKKNHKKAETKQEESAAASAPQSAAEPEESAPVQAAPETPEVTTEAAAAELQPAAPQDSAEPAEVPAEQPAAQEESACPAPEPAEPAPDEPAQAQPQLPQSADLDEENSLVILQEETPELAAQDPEAPCADGEENNTTSQHTPEGSVLLTPEEIRQALDAGALEDAETQCIDLGDENGFLRWLWNWLFGRKNDTASSSTASSSSAASSSSSSTASSTVPTYSGWRTEGGKTYYYSQSTNKKLTGIQSVDGKLYYFDASGALQNGVTFGIDVSKYQTDIDWDKIKKSGVSFAIIRIGYRGYGASGTLVKDPKFEEHFTNARNAGMKVGVYFFTQAISEAEAREEAQGCNRALNGRMLDYPIFYDTEASTSSTGNGRADKLGVAERTKYAVAFCEEVKNLGYQPGVYASTTWYRKRVDYDTLKQYTIWNAHYGVSSSPINCDLWQGTEKARINGYDGELDANISYIG